MRLRTVTKLVKTRKDHVCIACGGNIKASNMAVCVLQILYPSKRVYSIHFFHYLDGADLRFYTAHSFNWIRQVVCSQC